MNSIQNHQIHQAIIAREIIDIYKFAPNKTDVAESLDVICFAMARLTEKNSVIDWDFLATLFDQLATNSQTSVNDIEKIYQRITSIIKDIDS
ncbi:MAG: hypothetical protein D8G53_12455 [Candidatus Saccharimonas sp.]|nr:MAG: hypothetical protein D8G53_12455 [Candidatus Saccharimonas sp.]